MTRPKFVDPFDARRQVLTVPEQKPFTHRDEARIAAAEDGRLAHQTDPAAQGRGVRDLRDGDWVRVNGRWVLDYEGC